jgi:hypothetical protein
MVRSEIKYRAAECPFICGNDVIIIYIFEKIVKILHLGYIRRDVYCMGFGRV